VSESVLDALAANGYGRVAIDDLIRLADCGITADDVFALPDRSIDTLIELHEHGVDADEARAILRLFPAIDAGTLLAFADHGVDADTAAAFTAFDPTLSAGDVVRLVEHGTDPDFVGGLAAHGYRGLGVEALLTLHGSGFTP